jgi:glucokinase
MLLGIDIGGTSIKLGVVDEFGCIVYKDSIPTPRNATADVLVESIVKKCREMIEQYPISAVGVGTPGTINFDRKTVSATNLPFENTPLVEMLEAGLDLPVYMNNDANCAALGEFLVSEGGNVRNMVMITLGTGIGGGIIIDKKIYTGGGAAGEIGHMCINAHGKRCACGLTGCWERYASATALIEMTKEAVEENPDSILSQLVEENAFVNGKTVFNAAAKECPDAKAVLSKYIDYLAIGIQNIVNVLNPDVIVLSGGISEAGEALSDPLIQKLGSNVKIKISHLKNDAGIIGSALLCKV